MYSRTKQISIFYIVEIIPRSLSSHRPREVGPGYLLEQTRLQKTVPSKVGLLLWPGEALLFLIPHWPRFTPCVRRRGAYSPYLKCIKRAGKSPYTTSACQKTHHITSGRFTPANIPPPGCSNTSSQKASSIFPKVLNARGFVAVAVTRASPSTRRNVIGHQVQSGSRGWGEEPPPPERKPTANAGGRSVPTAPRASEPGTAPASHSPYSPPQRAARRRGRKCVTRPRPSLSRSSFAPSRRCSGPAPCSRSPGTPKPGALLLAARPNEKAVAPRGELGKTRMWRALGPNQGWRQGFVS